MSNDTITYTEEFPVLIVGGSVVGLSTALFLAWHNIPTLLVERHHSTSIHARAGGFNARTMELYRQVGIESAIFQRETPPSELGEMGLRVESLVGKSLDTSEMIVNQQYQQPDPFVSPTRRAMIGQDKLEPILRARAIELGSDIRFGTEMLAFEQDEEGVTAQLRERTTGKTYRVRTCYLIAADGNQSAIRRQLGIETYGYGFLGHWLSVLFRTDLSKVLGERKIGLCFVNNETVEGIMGQTEDRWGLFAHVRPRPGERVDALSEARRLELIRAAIGIPDQPVEILSTLYWELASRVAERYQQGRVFLAGDAAHVSTTMGAFGANTGIADAHNLAWKLASILKGYASPKLLTSYEAERQPAADLAVSVSLGLYAYRMPGHENKAGIMRSADDLLMRVRKSPEAAQPTAFSVTSGYRYQSTAIISEQEENAQLFENEPSGQPGTRAPHIWLEHAGERVSTLDLYGRNFVLLTGSAENGWREATARVGEDLGLMLDVYLIGSGESHVDEEQNFFSSHAITSSGAVLVRPDGFIAWRVPSAIEQPAQALMQALTQLLSR